MTGMNWIGFIAVLCAGASLSMAQLQFIEPTEGKAFPDKDPNRDCTTPGIFRFNAFSSAGRNVNFVIVTVEPSSAGNLFEVGSSNELLCDAASVQPITYTITAQGDDTVDQSTVTFTVSFVGTTDPLEITLPATTLTLVRDLFETVADQPATIDFEFLVSKEGAVVTVLPVSPETDVPFEATLKDGTTDTYFLNLTQSLGTFGNTFSIDISASISGPPAEEATERVNVTLENRPQFTSPFNESYTESVDENIASSTAIVELSASDADNDALTFSIVNTTPPTNIALFIIDGTELKTADDIGNEFNIDEAGMDLTFNLLIRVSDGTYQSETTIVINIQDINDVPPAFSPGQTFLATVLETIPAGEEIFKATASDLDFSAPNNDIMFSLTGTDNDHFSINDEGSVTVASPSQLNFTNKQQYKLGIVVTDGGTPSLSTMASFNVTVETAPKFITPSDSNSAISVPEDTASDTSIFKFVGEDEDNEPQDLEYTLESVEPASSLTFFYMDGDTLKTNTTFDLEKAGGFVADYMLTTSVTDGKYTATTILSVNITDVNDEAPAFDEASYAKDVLETQNAGEEILKVSASDRDLTSPGNEFSFSLTGTASNDFTIDTNTGSISVTSPSMLNYTNIPVYNLQVVVTDKGSTNQLSSSVPLTLTIKTAPMFIEPSNTGTVITTSETTGPNSQLFVTEVMDKDQAPISLTYSVTSVQPASGTAFFTMDGLTLKTDAGITTSTFDLEPSGSDPVQSYLVAIRVFDGTYSADTSIRINITDINDQTPEISGPITETIDDTLGIGQEVVVVSATDDDYSEAFNSVTYSLAGLVGSEDQETFQIDSSSGSITLASELKKRTYTFLVIAKDGGAREGSATVTISITDTVDECTNSPCQNAGTCYNNINYFYCDCVNGWTGTTCDTNINDCDPNQCENGGECVDGIASYSCNCTSGWTGTDCTEACTNNRYGRNCAETCQCNETRLAADMGIQKCNIETGYCFCNAMWTGADCTIDVDECAVNSSLCTDLSDQVCENTPGSYECVCRQGYVKNTTDVCVQDNPENTTVSTNAGEIVIRVDCTQDLENCPDLNKPSEYDGMKIQIQEGESIRIPTAISVEAFGPRCGSITYELAIVINDTDEARVSLANDLSEISNGRPLLLEGESTVTTAMNVSGSAIATNRTIDASVLLCNIYTSYSACSSSYECRISAGVPRCVKRGDDDNTELILGLALGIPLAILAFLCLALVICYCHRIKRDKEQDSSKRSERPRHANYEDRRDAASKSFVPGYEDLDQRVPYMPYMPSVEYNYRSSLPILGGSNKEASGMTHKDWIFYSPARNDTGNYRYSQRY